MEEQAWSTSRVPCSRVAAVVLVLPRSHSTASAALLLQCVGLARASGVQSGSITLPLHTHLPVRMIAEFPVVTGNPGQSQGSSCAESCVTTEKTLILRALQCKQQIKLHCAMYMSGEKHHLIFHFAFCCYSCVILPLTSLAVHTELNMRSVKSLHVCSWIILITVSQLQVKIFSFPWKEGASVPTVNFCYEDGLGWLV